MLKRLLNNGVFAENPEGLNRKIRISNLIAMITIFMVLSYTPLYFFFLHPLDLMLTYLFFLAAILNFPLGRRKKYVLSFTLNIIMGYIYFTWGALAYGTSTNIQFFLLIMCLVVSIFYDNKYLVRIIIGFSIVLFFSIIFYMKNKAGIIQIPNDIKDIEGPVGNTILLALFIIVPLLVLFYKNENLRYQFLIEEKKKIIEEKNKDIIDSINYATRIQKALLPNAVEIENHFPGSFVLYRPKDIVSGDFFWTHQTNNYFFLAVGDCTGHGVPGALMSVLGMNLLNEIVEGKAIYEPSEILETLRSSIIKALNKEVNQGEYKDGMDMQLIRINKANNECVFAGANNPLYILQNGILNEYKANKQPIGYSPEMKPFSSQTITLQKNEHAILFTDGYADQFGGLNNKKFMYKNFKLKLIEALVNQNSNPVKYLNEAFDDWKGTNEQVDDICVLAVKIC